MTEQEVLAQMATPGRKPQAKPQTPRCPECGGAMRHQTGRIGDFLGCLRYPDCRGKRQLTQPVAEVKNENTPRQLVESPILGLTKAALTGLLANPATSEWTAAEVGENAVGIAAATLLALKMRTEKKNDANS